ncbi:hypothetical protein ANCCEY_11461 [Ancylostoma ceylanicum]|uniref:Uncharacterized protein n=1 Tax=Ancylostoma ceylanicum TaxID=53326 RepID=A0A0D6LBK7_9BILA|nr:hypothetical protein ANCCEY_11461 [Ancylostoma ceylanicum]
MQGSEGKRQQKIRGNMVRVLSNGEVGATDGFASLWNNANDRLRQFGLESFYVAGYRVDPLHLVVAVLGFLLSGPMMLAIVVAAIVISQSSSDNTAPAPAAQGAARSTDSNRPRNSSYFAQGDGPQQSSRSKDFGAFSGTGQRLGTLHGAGLSWPYVFIASGVALRIASSPLHIFAEKLFARRLHAQNFFTEGILKKLSEHYKVELKPNASRTRLELKTSDPKIIAHSEKLLAEVVPQYMAEHGLQATRIQNLKMCTIPLWIFSSFAVRNSQRKIYPIAMHTWRTKSYDFALAFFTCFAVTIMCQLPACIPLYWLSVSVSGFVQAQLLRHPSVKKLLGISRLPTDSRTPFRDLFLTRPKQT